MHVMQFLGDANGAAVAGLGGMMLLFIIIGFVLSIFWIWMLIDCLTSNLPATEKLIWFLVIFFLHILGAILYYAIAKSGRTTGVA